MRRNRQLRIQIHQLKDTALFALALWLAHRVRTLWELDLFGLGNYFSTKWHWEIFNLSHPIEPFSEFQWLFVVLIPAVPLILDELRRDPDQWQKSECAR